MTQDSYDSIVIGGGSAGLAFAETAGRLDARVLLIERAELGGTCVNRGCVPKKILWSAGEVIRANRHAADREFTTETTMNYSTLTAERDAHIASINKSFEDTLNDANVTLKRGNAQLVDAHTVRMDKTVYTAKAIILATGGRPSEMDIDGAELLETSDDVLGWTIIPDDMVIVGGGYIGCEFAAIFNALGVAVTLVHDGDYLLDTFPEKMAKHVQAGLVASGITVKINDGLTGIKSENGALRYDLTSGQSAIAQHVVAAVGRTPNIAQLGDFADQLARAENGALSINDRFQTSVSGIYAVGDVADRLPLTPVATADGTALAHILHGQGAAPIDLDLVATTTFVYPPAAFVGNDDRDAFSADTLTPLSQHVLGPETDHDADFYRLSAAGDDRLLTGVQIVAKGAEDMIAMAAALIAAKAPASSFRHATAVHPSFAEEFFPELPTKGQ